MWKMGGRGTGPTWTGQEDGVGSGEVVRREKGINSEGGQYIAHGSTRIGEQHRCLAEFKSFANRDGV